MATSRGAAQTAPIVGEIAAARRASSTRWRLTFFAVWLAIIVGVILVLMEADTWDWEFVVTSGPFIIGGAWITILVSLTSITFATGLALVGALGRLIAKPGESTGSRRCMSLSSGARRCSSRSSSSTWRCRSSGSSSPPVGGIFALAFNYGAYMTEIFRAGIQAVPRGQREAAQALGMPERLIMRRIVLPQAFRIVTPAIGNDFVSMIKDSSLVYVLGVQELLWRASTIGRRELPAGGPAHRRSRVLGADHRLQLLPGAPRAAHGPR